MSGRICAFAPSHMRKKRLAGPCRNTSIERNCQHGGAEPGRIFTNQILTSDRTTNGFNPLPTRDQAWSLQKCLDSIFHKTDYEDYEIIVLDNACAAVKRAVYLQLGGFDENLAVTFNGIDFCLRLREAGYRIVWTPHAELIHHESASRGFDDSTPKQIRFLAEVDYMNSKWGDILQRDPFYNPDVSLGEDPFTLAFPPRTIKPWQSAGG